MMGDMIISLLLGKGKIVDIDLSRINRKYDVAEGDGLQFLK